MLFDEDELELAENAANEKSATTSTDGKLPGDSPERATSDHNVEVHPNPSSLTLQQAREVLALIVRECVAQEFQAKLQSAYEDAEGNADEQATVCEQLGVDVEIRVAEQLGFEASPSGAALLRFMIGPYAENDKEVQHRYALIRWLCDPDSQKKESIPRGPARCVVSAQAAIWHSNGQHICTVQALLDNTVRSLKENISLNLTVPWHGQKLFLQGRELFDQVVLSSVMRIATVVDFTLELRRAEVVKWVALLRKGSGVLKTAPPELLADTEFILPAVQIQASVLSHVPAELRENRKLLTQIIPYCGQAIQFVAPHLKADRDLVIAAVRHDAWALEYVAEELKDDREVVLAAVRRDGEAIQFACPALQSDAEILLAATSRDPSAILSVLPELQQDRNLVMSVVKTDWRLLRSLPQEMQADREVVKCAVRQSGWALQYASPERRADREVVLLAMDNNGEALRFVAPSLLLDREVVLAALRQSPMALGLVAPEVQDAEIAETAVRMDKRALAFVVPKLRFTIAHKFGINVATEGNPWLELEYGTAKRSKKHHAAVPTQSGGLSMYFAVLNIPETATREEIRQRFHRLALQYHPDKFAGDPEIAKQMFQKISSAYEALRQALRF